MCICVASEVSLSLNTYSLLTSKDIRSFPFSEYIFPSHQLTHLMISCSQYIIQLLTTYMHVLVSLKQTVDYMHVLVTYMC